MIDNRSLLRYDMHANDCKVCNFSETEAMGMVRLKDIAEACGVSVATVSRALNGVTNEGKERTALI